jgi:hypothetical protein
MDGLMPLDDRDSHLLNKQTKLLKITEHAMCSLNTALKGSS